MKTLALFFAVVVAGVSGCSTTASAFGRKAPETIPAKPDVIADAVLSGDATSLVEGCGAQPIVGFTYCRVTEGDVADQSISFIGPPATCADSESTCVFIKVFNQSGQIAWGGSIPRGQTRVQVDWKTLLGAPQFQSGNRGFWSWITEVHWVDSDGHDRVSKSQGDIVLRVYKKGYVPLDRVQDDSNFVWSWVDGDYLYKMTSGLRAFIGKVQK